MLIQNGMTQKSTDSSVNQKLSHVIIILFFLWVLVSVFKATLKSVDVLDLSSESPCWKSDVDMLIKRKDLGVGVINNFLYVVS